MNIIKKIYNHLLWRFKFTLDITIPQLFLSKFMPNRVMSGPFEGMNYINRSTGSPILPKYAGTYESQLHDVLYSIKSNGYERFIDVGAAEGYYVVGVMKYLLPKGKEVIAFESEEIGRKRIKKLGEINDCYGINIQGFCDVDLLAKTMDEKKTFLLVDIEGGEFDLLNTSKINFQNCDLLVEIHDKEEPQLKKLKLIEDFKNTHEVIEIQDVRKKLPENVEWKPIIKKYGHIVVEEYRGPQSWLFMKTKKQ